MIVTRKYTPTAPSPDTEKSQFPGDRSAISGLRYYSPTLGRFINKDPIEEKGGLNLYAFGGNNSVNGYDYLGNSWFSKYIIKPIQKLLGKVNTAVAKSGVNVDGVGAQTSIPITPANPNGQTPRTGPDPFGGSGTGTVTGSGGGTIVITDGGTTATVANTGNSGGNINVTPSPTAPLPDPYGIITLQNGNLGDGVTYIPPPTTTSPTEPVTNPSGFGYVVESTGTFFAGVGGGGGSSWLILDNGTVTSFVIVQGGVGFGGKGASLQFGPVGKVYKPSDFAGFFINVSGNLGAGFSVSNWIDGSGAVTGGIAPGAGVSGSLQYYEPTGTYNTGMSVDDILNYFKTHGTAPPPVSKPVPAPSGSATSHRGSGDAPNEN